ncbi:MAG: hypothetical protein HUU22_04745 [Phycisphaerae bacterium]|nr:hypothetical protein [Phycisphaerae bacterium]NUQ45320.1 hypothetical protein [Phycisphaerae bacterium]
MRIAISTVSLLCAVALLIAGCTTLGNLTPGSLLSPSGISALNVGSVLGRVQPGVGFNVTLTTDNGATVIINNEPVTLEPIGVAVVGDRERDAADAAVTTDPQDGRVFYSVTSALGAGTQARVSVKSVPSDPVVFPGLDDSIHGFTIFIRATRPGTTSADVTSRGAAPLFNLAAIAGDVEVIVTGVTMLNNGGAAFGNVFAELPREFFPPTLLPNQRPMVMFLRSGGTGQSSGGKFIHLAGALENVVDTNQNRTAANGGTAIGSGRATAQVPGEFAAVNPAVYAFAPQPDDANAATGEFTWTMGQAAYDGNMTVNAGQVYFDPALPINAVGNALAHNGDVFEIAVSAIMVTAP